MLYVRMIDPKYTNLHPCYSNLKKINRGVADAMLPLTNPQHFVASLRNEFEIGFLCKF